MSDGKRQPGRKASGLLGDLESIRSLLEEAEGPATAQPGRRNDRSDAPAVGNDAEGSDAVGSDAVGSDAVGLDAVGTDAVGPDNDDDVPLLEDVVHGGVSVNETFASGEGEFQEAPGSSGLNDEIFKALLSDEWRESARALLDQARDAIERHQTEWTPQHTDELNEALKVRIDETVQNWLKEVVRTRAGELRQALLESLSEQIHVTIDQQFNANEDPDGE